MVSVGEIFNYFRPWTTKFRVRDLGAEVEYGGTHDLVEDPRIATLNHVCSVSGKRVLELGSLEGGHTLRLHSLGAREIVAIEGRVENYIKCCVVKNLFDLSRARILLGNFAYYGNFPWKSLGHFDLCVCIGVLYHLDDPAYLIKEVAQISDRLFLWTHIADGRFPHGPEMILQHPEAGYRGKLNYESDPDSPLAGFTRSELWLFEEDLQDLLVNSGFNSIETLDMGTKYEWKAPYILLYAWKEAVK